MPRPRTRVVINCVVQNEEGNLTNYMFGVCCVAALGGLLFGYDSGLVASRASYLMTFVPDLALNDKEIRSQLYCRRGSQYLDLYTSSVYIAASVSSLLASSVSRYYGRHISISLAGFIYLLGVCLCAGATHFIMLCVGRMLTGVGLGFAVQSIPMYISEIAPPYIRGAMNQLWQLNITIGILLAHYSDYWTSEYMKSEIGWRVTLAVSSIPALLLGVAALFLPNPPCAMLERGRSDNTKDLLHRLRGDTGNGDQEFLDIMAASEVAKNIEHPWMEIVKPRYRPHLVMCIVIPFFQQFTGINAVMFYLPLLFKALGFGETALLASSVITGVVNAVSTCVSLSLVDSSGRRPFLIQGGVQMAIFQVAIAAYMGLKFGVSGEGSLSKNDADTMVMLICFYVAAFAWSWGPMAWLLPSEICPLEIRSAANALNASVNMLFTFVIAEASLVMFCTLKYGLFLLFAGFCVIMTVFVYYFLPETRQVPIEDMDAVWKEHWFWGKFIPDDAIPDRDAFRHLNNISL